MVEKERGGEVEEKGEEAEAKSEKSKSRAEMPRRRLAKDDASHVNSLRRSSSHRSTQSRKSVLDQMDEESDFHANDWVFESDFSPLRNDLSNPDLILRSRTVDSIEFVRQMARSKALDDTLENYIEYKTPSFAAPFDARDDISIDDDTQRAVDETKFPGVLQMIQRLLGDEPIPSPSITVLVEDDIRNEQ